MPQSPAVREHMCACVLKRHAGRGSVRAAGGGSRGFKLLQGLLTIDGFGGGDGEGGGLTAVELDSGTPRQSYTSGSLKTTSAKSCCARRNGTERSSSTGRISANTKGKICVCWTRFCFTELGDK